MPDFVLTFRVDGLNMDDESSIDRCYERCHDITLIERDGVALASFNREADTVEDAIASAVHDLEVALPDARVHSMERELVSSGEIAERAGISRESVRLYFEGARGPGGFPRPVAWSGDRMRLWAWGEVNAWFAGSSKRVDEENYPDADIVAVVNAALAEARRGASRPVYPFVLRRLEAVSTSADRLHNPGAGGVSKMMAG